MKSDQLNALLRLAEKRPLSETEEAMLRNLLADEDNRIAASADQHLRTNYVATGQERQWQPQELAQIAGQVEQQAKRRARRQRVQHGTRRIAWAVAVFIGVFGLLVLWSQFSRPAIEPAAPLTLTPTATSTMTPSPTPEPTPTLVAGYRYADLSIAPAHSFDILSGDTYSQTITEIAEAWHDNLYLPNQIPENWSFAGATIHDEDEVLELAFVADESVLWILSQAASEERPLTAPLPVTYQPLIRVDETLYHEDRAITVGELPAHAYQYEYVYREGNAVAWEIYNTVTWQIDEQLFTLTHVSQRLEPSSQTALKAHNLALQLYEPDS
jgi:hypothetical protein